MSDDTGSTWKDRISAFRCTIVLAVLALFSATPPPPTLKWLELDHPIVRTLYIATVVAVASLAWWADGRERERSRMERVAALASANARHDALVGHITETGIANSDPELRRLLGEAEFDAIRPNGIDQ